MTLASIAILLPETPVLKPEERHLLLLDNKPEPEDRRLSGFFLCVSICTDAARCMEACLIGPSAKTTCPKAEDAAGLGHASRLHTLKSRLGIQEAYNIGSASVGRQLQSGSALIVRLLLVRTSFEEQARDLQAPFAR